MMSDVLAATLGALVGGVIGSISPLLHAHFQARRKQKNILHTLAGELIAITSSSAQNELTDRLSEISNEAKLVAEYRVPKIFDERLDPAPIYGGIIDQLGHLDPKQVAFFVDFHRNLKLARFRYLNFQDRTIGTDEFDEFEKAIQAVLTELAKLPEYEAQAQKMI